MGKSSPSGQTTVQQNATPWTGQIPYLTGGSGVTGLYPTASALYQSAPWTSYPNQTVAPTPGQTYQALSLQQQRALSGSPVTNAAQGYATNLLSGNLLGAGNPYFSNMVNQIGNAIRPQTDSEFNMNGRAGSGANNYSFDSALANTAGNLAYQNYNNILTQMNSQAFNAPTLANVDYTNIGALGDVGNTLQGIQQNYINEDINRFNQNQQLPYQQLGAYQSLLGSPTAGTSSTSSPYFTNPLGSVLGAGIGGLGLYNGLSNAGLFSGLGAGAGTGLSAAELAAIANAGGTAGGVGAGLIGGTGAIATAAL